MRPVPRIVNNAVIGDTLYTLEADYPEGIAARYVVRSSRSVSPVAMVWAVTDENVSQAFLTASSAFSRTLRKALAESRHVRSTLAVARAAIEHGDTELPAPPKTPVIPGYHVN